MIDPARDPETAHTVALMRAEIARVPSKDARERLDHLLGKLEEALGRDGLPAPAVLHASLQRAVAGVDYLAEFIGVLADSAKRVHTGAHDLPGAPPAQPAPLPRAGAEAQRKVG